MSNFNPLNQSGRYLCREQEVHEPERSEFRPGIIHFYITIAYIIYYIYIFLFFT